MAWQDDRPHQWTGIGSNTARAQFLWAFAPDVIALAVAVLLLAETALHFLALQELIGVVAIPLKFEVALALALLKLAVEVTLAFLGLGQRHPWAEQKRQGQNPEGMAKQGSAVQHDYNVAHQFGFSKAQIGENLRLRAVQKEAARLVSEGAAPGYFTFIRSEA